MQNVNTMNRRNFLGGASSALIAAPILGLTVPKLAHATLAHKALLPSIHPSLGTQANLPAAESVMAALINATKAAGAGLGAGQLGPALSILPPVFLWMTDSGLTAELQNSFNANPDLLYTYPTASQIQSFQAQFIALGVSESTVVVADSQAFNPGGSSTAAATTYLRGVGVSGAQIAVMGQMQTLQNHLAHPDTDGIPNPCPYEILSIIWAGLALITPPPLDFICALISIWYQFVALVFC